MPIPAAAGVIAACVHYFLGTPVFSGAVAAVWIGLIGLVGFLMVSTWRFWSGKEITLTDRHPFQLLVLIGAAVSVLLLFSRYYFL